MPVIESIYITNWQHSDKIMIGSTSLVNSDDFGTTEMLYLMMYVYLSDVVLLANKISYF